MTSEAVTDAMTTAEKETMEQQTNTAQRNDEHAPEEHTAPAVNEQPETDPVTDPDSTPDTEPEADQDPETDPDTGDLADAIGDGDQLKKANREAANYRHQLREAQAEIEQLKTAAETGLQQAFTSRVSAFTQIDLDAKEARQYSEHIGEVYAGDPAEIKLKHPEDFERMTGLSAHDLTYDGTSTLDDSRYAKELGKLFRSRPELFEGTPGQQKKYSAMRTVAEAFNGSAKNEPRGKDWQGAFRPADNE